MVRLWFREVVKFGHIKDYKAACKAWNEAAVPLGLPPVRYFSSGWGIDNEIYGEADFEDAADIDRRFAAAAAANDSTYDAAVASINEHVAEGQRYTWVLSDMPLG